MEKKKKKKKIRKYVIVDDKYGWWWMGPRWSYVRCAAEIYTKKTLPESIFGLRLVKVDEKDVTTWKYVRENPKRTASVLRI